MEERLTLADQRLNALVEDVKRNSTKNDQYIEESDKSMGNRISVIEKMGNSTLNMTTNIMEKEL